MAKLITASVHGIAIREKSRAPMQSLEQVHITCESGLAGDYRGKPGKRQVTLLSQSQWKAACAEVGRQLPWTLRRANLLLDGIFFSPDMVGRTIQIGESAKLLINHETDPCYRMDAQFQGLTRALTPDWRAGVCCTVTECGIVHLKDKVVLLD